MSRSGHSDDCEDVWLWRGAVKSAMEGRRGQAFLKELLAALDALPEKKLIADDLENDGAVCAIGAVGKARGIDMSGIDPHNQRAVSATFGIARAMSAEIAFENDEGRYGETPEARFSRMRAWVESQILPVELVGQRGEKDET